MNIEFWQNFVNILLYVSYLNFSALIPLHLVLAVLYLISVSWNWSVKCLVSLFCFKTFFVIFFPTVNSILMNFFYKSFFNVLFIFERERETECEQVSGRERGRHRIRSRLVAPSCQHRARYGAWTHELWEHDLSQSWMLNRLSHPGTPM